MTSATLVTPASTRSESAPRAIPQTLVRAHQRAYIRTIFVIDTAIIAASVAAGYYLRFHSGRFGGEPDSPVPYAFVILGLTAVWLMSLKLHRGYDDRLIGYGAEEYRRVASATLRLAGDHRDLRLHHRPGRCAVVPGALVRDRPRRAGGGPLRRPQVAAPGPQARRRLVAPGAGGRGHAARHRARAHAAPRAVHRLPRRGGVHPGRACSRRCRSASATCRWSARSASILEAAETTGVDTVAVTASGELTATRLRRLGWQLEGTGIDLVLAPALTDVAGPRIHTRPVAGLPLIHVEAPEFRGGRKLVKDFVDRALALFGLIVRVAGDRGDRDRHQARRPGPGVLPADPRRHGRPRVRRVQVPHDGGQRRRDAGASCGPGTRPTACCSRCATTRGSPGSGGSCASTRWTSCRSWSTCFLGHMSLVGPRPPLPQEVARYDGDVARRLLVKPGITGLWQVSGRSDLTLGGRHPPRPLLRRELVAHRRPDHPVEDVRRSGPGPRSVLTGRSRECPRPAGPVVLEGRASVGRATVRS